MGVVGSITPWNYPLLITCWHVIPGLLAGLHGRLAKAEAGEPHPADGAQGPASHQ